MNPSTSTNFYYRYHVNKYNKYLSMIIYLTLISVFFRHTSVKSIIKLTFHPVKSVVYIKLSILYVNYIDTELKV
ncbi:hypothetical protein GCM10010916_09540 [Paenibacillus abyssi]|uniref:Uncharacterized protein n=1 Tax=Paenibacillus abyssi TaxID=1340531 RepID=A0A917FQ78_9BACL|nr:hypothetical protein GCM10010916_09540 [Paenibacillus abyssi]